MTCGTTQTTITARISDCAAKNGATATWSGNTNGNAGQSTWNLVTYSGTNSLYSGHNAEVWQDAQTGLLWSSLVAGTTDMVNWCMAAGNAQSNDPSNLCNSTTYQTYYPLAESDCVETGTIPALATEAVSSTLGNAWSGSYVAAKGGMGAQSSSSSPAVYWRLPTIYDYEQADLHGISFVMPDMGPHAANWEWSATINSIFRQEAYNYEGSAASFSYSSRSNTFSARCVGR